MTSELSEIASQERQSIKTWPGYIRAMHWTLASCVLGAWIMSENIRWVHEYLGYGAVTIVTIRIFAGFLDGGFVKFTNFVKGPAETFGYLKQIWRGKEARHIGHNPAGGAMILALLLAISMTGLTGWLLTTDRFFGEELLEDVHQFLANGVIFLVALHLAGVLLASVRHKENLVAAMITGRKRLT